MINRQIIIAVFGIISLFGCTKSSENLGSADTAVMENPISADDALAKVGNPIDHDKVNVLKTLYIISKEGEEYREDKNINSSSLGKYSYGQRLEVIEDGTEWLGVTQYVSRTVNVPGRTIVSDRWEKVYVRKSNTGEYSEINIGKEELNIVSSMNIDGKNEYFAEGTPLVTIIELDFVDEKTFKSNQAKSLSYLLEDTTVIIKKDGVIELPTSEEKKVFTDINSDNDDRRIYSYLGQYEVLNSYLILGNYYEGIDYTIVNKDKGEEVAKFSDFPVISPSKKYIACIYSNPYENTSDLEIYSINNGKLELTLKANFSKWMAMNEQNSFFWGPDNCLYVKAVHSQINWDAEEGMDKNYQYIKIKVL